MPQVREVSRLVIYVYGNVISVDILRSQEEYYTRRLTRQKAETDTMVKIEGQRSTPLITNVTLWVDALEVEAFEFCDIDQIEWKANATE